VRHTDNELGETNITIRIKVHFREASVKELGGLHSGSQAEEGALEGGDRDGCGLQNEDSLFGGGVGHEGAGVDRTGGARSGDEVEGRSENRSTVKYDKKGDISKI